MSSKHEIPWTFDARDIPQGWVRLASLGGGGGGRKQSQKYNMVHAAIGRGDITSEECIKIKMTPNDPRGPIYVSPQAIDRVVSEAQAAVDSLMNHRQPIHKRAGNLLIDRQIEAAATALCEMNTGVTLMRATLERLTAAVESIATQPKGETAGSWRDMNGETL
jgi:hypothetical protein